MTATWEYEVGECVVLLFVILVCDGHWKAQDDWPIYYVVTSELHAIKLIPKVACFASLFGKNDF